MSGSYFQFRANYAYEQALRLQGVLSSENYTGLLAFETADSTITFGVGSNPETELAVSPSFLQQQDVTILSTDRGGPAMWHGPGQLVGFPVANLRDLYGDSRAVKRFVDELLLGLAHACAVLGVKNVESRSDQLGLWTKKGRLASLGLSFKDGYVFHGFSLNVSSSVLVGHSLLVCEEPVTCLEMEGVRVESFRDLAKSLLPYLTVINGSEVAQSAPTVTYEAKVSSLMARVSRSPMAMDHFLTTRN